MFHPKNIRRKHYHLKLKWLVLIFYIKTMLYIKIYIYVDQQNRKNKVMQKYYEEI